MVKTIINWALSRQRQSMAVPENSVMLLTIRPSRAVTLDNIIWSFDDPERSLTREPFVGTTNDAITAVALLKGYTVTAPLLLQFSRHPLPHHDIRLDRVTEEASESGHDYLWAKMNVLCWLCPALLKYFSTAPPHIYARITQ